MARRAGVRDTAAAREAAPAPPLETAPAGRGPAEPADPAGDGVHWHGRVVGRSLRVAQQRSIDNGAKLIRAAARVLERNGGASLTVQEVADEAGQSLRTLYQYFASKDDLLLAVHEEAMRTFARLTAAAIAGLTDPVERLAGALIASGRMLALHDKAGVDRGLSRLRLKLSEADPALVARSQEPVTAVFHELVAAVVATQPDPPMGIDQATYLVSAARSSLMLSLTLGNELGVELPDVIELSMFCLSGIGVERPRAWHQRVEHDLAMAGADGRSILRRLANQST